MNGSVYWPNSWAGLWIAGDGKAIEIEHRRGGVLVTVFPNRHSPPYDSEELISGKKDQVERIEAFAQLDELGRRHLKLQARSSKSGPEYRLYSTIHDPEGVLLPAADDTPVKHLVLAPGVAMGVHGVKEDIAWAYPLRPLEWVGFR